MGRPAIQMTPDERSEHVRKGNNRRKKSQRDREAEEKARAGQLSSAELNELIEMLVSMPLGDASLLLAKLQRSYKKEYGIMIPGLREASFAGYISEEEAPEDYNIRTTRAKKLGLIRYFAMDAIPRLKAQERNRNFEIKEALEAAALGIDVETYKKQKRQAKKSLKKKQEDARTMERIRKRPKSNTEVTTLPL